MPGIDPKVMCHKLSICAEARPVSQRKRKMRMERKLAVETEVAKLLEAGFIREVHYTTWLANVVMVKKPNEKWRMCIDYTNLNKACPKDAYPLPNIDRLVDGASGHGVLTFFDAYSGYNQIPMHPRDEEKTTFITDSANYCYQVMSFGLKNAGATWSLNPIHPPSWIVPFFSITTYQRLMNKVFRHQLGRNMEVYVDDMVVKSRDLEQHVIDLSEVFQQLRKYDMRLNLEKCVFGVSGGKFLGFMLSARGIEANPDKCMAVINMVSPRNLKEVQKLAGRLTALSRFPPCLVEIAKPIVGLLRKVKKFEWSIECEEAFRMLKERLGSPPVLSKPHPQVDMIVYLCVSNEAISAVLIQEVWGQQLIYFISRMLQEAETRYQLLEKVALGLVNAARRLSQYFQSHRVVVLTDCPIAKVLRKPELAGRMMAWSIELSEFDISFEVRGPVKSQFLADFVNELQPRGHFVSDLWTSMWTVPQTVKVVEPI
uniref:Retrovirus-related Pol polyprotein from transposon 17.6 n=1 Tax=Cajanus cajan TaxID=3821 RepID=A0A151T1S7_CAJCA|nr:Retrovirus-related Pol polyprotein from transposon 17.6 [Cajanus cajan]